MLKLHGKYKHQYKIKFVNDLLLPDFKEVYYLYFKWCKENCDGDYSYDMIDKGRDVTGLCYSGYVFSFEEISDFIAFKLFVS